MSKTTGNHSVIFFPVENQMIGHAISIWIESSLSYHHKNNNIDNNKDNRK